MRLKPLDILKAGLIIAAAAATVVLIAVEVGVVIVAIKFFAVIAASPPPAPAVGDTATADVMVLAALPATCISPGRMGTGSGTED